MLAQVAGLHQGRGLAGAAQRRRNTTVGSVQSTRSSGLRTGQSPPPRGARPAGLLTGLVAIAIVLGVFP